MPLPLPLPRCRHATIAAAMMPRQRCYALGAVVACCDATMLRHDAMIWFSALMMLLMPLPA